MGFVCVELNQCRQIARCLVVIYSISICNSIGRIKLVTTDTHTIYSYHNSFWFFFSFCFWGFLTCLYVFRYFYECNFNRFDWKIRMSNMYVWKCFLSSVQTHTRSNFFFQRQQQQKCVILRQQQKLIKLINQAK